MKKIEICKCEKSGFIVRDRAEEDYNRQGPLMACSSLEEALDFIVDYFGGDSDDTAATSSGSVGDDSRMRG